MQGIGLLITHCLLAYQPEGLLSYMHTIVLHWHAVHWIQTDCNKVLATLTSDKVPDR